MSKNLDFNASAGILINLVATSLALGRVAEARESIRMALVEASKERNEEVLTSDGIIWRA